jgi:hypothetical protein
MVGPILLAIGINIQVEGYPGWKTKKIRAFMGTLGLGRHIIWTDSTYPAITTMKERSVCMEEQRVPGSLLAPADSECSRSGRPHDLADHRKQRVSKHQPTPTAFDRTLGAGATWGQWSSLRPVPAPTRPEHGGLPSNNATVHSLCYEKRPFLESRRNIPCMIPHSIFHTESITRRHNHKIMFSSYI